ncbi:MAG: BON domain-containing protein [Proteobacteria bacterium]|nr:BON domain-containing protein [Burkholderiales bacterium]
MNSRVAALTLSLASVFASGCVPLIVGGVATGVLIADDRRTTGTVLDDQNIELRLGNQLNTEFGKVANVNVTVYNRVVLVTGEASTATVRSDIEKLARATPNARHVQNELQIAVPSSLTSRSNDTFITGRVKARLVDNQARGSNPRVQANHVKVVTEGGVVYLMGIVSAAEADQATEIARTTSGVTRVVRIFETGKGTNPVK